MMAHVYYQTSDADAPDYIKDRNGEVVLGMCKLCRKGENELGPICEAAPPASRELLNYCTGDTSFSTVFPPVKGNRRERRRLEALRRRGSHEAN